MIGGENLVFNERIASSYESWYDSKRGRIYDELEKELILELVSPQDCKSLLEVGCGTGHFLKWFSNFGLRVVGIDNSSYMIEEARENLSKDIELKIMDAHQLNYSDSSFDVVSLITTLEFLDNPQKAITEAFRVAKEKVFLGVLNKFSLLNIKRRIKGIFKSTVYNHAKFYSVRELLSLVKKSNINFSYDWATVIPNRPSKNIFGAFIGITLTK
jgi:ubiquinone/menaquinone biosynthesis C-methylase UbiE